MATRTELAVSFTYRPSPPPPPPEINLEIDRKVLRETLVKVQDALLRHNINGGKRKLSMDTVCDRNTCGTAACIGGWASIFLLGFEPKDYEERSAVENLFGRLSCNFGQRLHDLFYEFNRTKDHNEPNVAATAIQRYLDGKAPWPVGEMPNKLRYRRPRVAKVAKTAKKK